jgi:E3 ubiquitin-protein ligase synoviolin
MEDADRGVGGAGGVEGEGVPHRQQQEQHVAAGPHAQLLARRGPHPTAPSSFQMHFGLYAIVSLVLMGMVSWKEWKGAGGVFYSAVVNMSHSKPANLIFANLAFVLVLTFARGIKSVFLGTLRDVEAEHLTERLSGSVMDTLLAMTIFRAELSISFAFQFVGLMFVKSFHWLVQKRSDYVGQTPVTSPSTYIRLATLQMMLLSIDIAMAWLTISHLRKHGVNIQLLFAFEYGLLATGMVSVAIKYALTLYDMLICQGRWDSKSVVFLYLDFGVDMIQMVVYLLFFVSVLVNYGLPLHIIRQIHQTFMSFQRRIGDLRRYRRATRHLEANFPDASPSDIDAAHNVCCICREELQQNAKKLPNCGHVMHLRCLRGWLEHQQRCPICRTPVLFEDLEPEQQRQRLEQLARPAAAPVGAQAPVVPPIGLAGNPNTNPAPTDPVVPNFSPVSSSLAGPVTESDMLAAVMSLQSSVAGMQLQLQSVQDQLDLLTVVLTERRASEPAPSAPAVHPEPLETVAGTESEDFSESSSPSSSSSSSALSSPSGPDDASAEDDVRKKRILKFSAPSSPAQ